jgi:hypothetical protein
MCSTIFENWVGQIMVLHKKKTWHSKNGKWIFCKVNKNPFGTIFFHPNTHACAQYGNIWTNYGIVTTMT